MDTSRIRCNVIDYRKGYIEVTTGTHSGCVNIETWNIDPSLEIENLDVRDQLFPDAAVISNTELELTIEMAKALVHVLQMAIEQAARIE